MGEFSAYAPILPDVRERVKGLFKDFNKEENTMKVSCKGFTGELTELKRYEITYPAQSSGVYVYDLSIYDREKEVEHSSTGVSLKDVKFLGGEVTYG